MGEGEIPMLGPCASPRLSITTTARSIVTHLTACASWLLPKLLLWLDSVARDAPGSLTDSAVL